MSQQGRYYSLYIPTKTFLRKYLSALYGDPIVINAKNYFGLSVIGYLDRKFYHRQADAVIQQQFDKFTDRLHLHLPAWWIRQTHFGTDLPLQNIIYLNKLFEERFEEDLSKYCVLMNTVGIELKDAREDFCKLFNIELEIDMTDEALKQKEFRFRKNNLKNFIANLSSQKNRIPENPKVYAIW